MSPLPRSFSEPISSRTTRLSVRLATWKQMRAGKLDLMRPVMTSTVGFCVASTRWMPTARLFWARRIMCCSTSLAAVIMRSAISSATMTMYGKWRGMPARSSSDSGRMRSIELFFAKLVVNADVTHAGPGQQRVAFFHFFDSPAENGLGLAHVGDDGVHQVGQVFIGAELDHFGVDHQHAHVVRAAGHEHRHDDRVEADAFARAGAACDEQVRQRRPSRRPWDCRPRLYRGKAGSASFRRGHWFLR